MMILRTFTRGLLRGTRKTMDRKPIDEVVCVDIECTCDSPVQLYPMEIIELACLRLDLTKIVDRRKSISHGDAAPIFHSYVKPVVNPQLTLFCQDLTGIIQDTVNNAEEIDKVVEKLMLWLKIQGLVDERYERRTNFAFVSCGNFDLKILAPSVETFQSNNNLDLPIYFKEWINVKKTFVNHKKEWPKGLYHMLERIGEDPSGRLHSALDDCKNLARVVEFLHLDGCEFYVTNKVS